jgi:hypothetical protein
MNNKYKAYIFVGTGFFMVLINIMSFIMDWETKFIPIGVIGIAFIAIGVKRVKRETSDQKISG